MRENIASKKKQTRKDDPVVKEQESHSRVQDKIDRDLEQSFPASDPPGWTLGIDRNIY